MAVPDYELAEDVTVTTPAELRAMAHPVRSTILDLLLERAATVGELASALGRPKSTVAHHVNVLVNAGMLKVVRTRRVRAIDERYYGRTARMFSVGALKQPRDNPMILQASALAEAAAEAISAHEADQLGGFLRHARITREQAREFWKRVVPLLHEFNQLPRAGDTVYGFAVGLYPTDHPALPDPPDGG
jgi:DNA-binding transcriptional ArsR family regulator